MRLVSFWFSISVSEIENDVKKLHKDWVGSDDCRIDKQLCLVSPAQSFQ